MFVHKHELTLVNVAARLGQTDNFSLDATGCLAANLSFLLRLFQKVINGAGGGWRRWNYGSCEFVSHDVAVVE